jgi:hypothetical protein
VNFGDEVKMIMHDDEHELLKIFTPLLHTCESTGGCVGLSISIDIQRHAIVAGHG